MSSTVVIKDARDVFVVVDKFPLGYKIWNIGDNMVDGYLPLARVDANYHVDVDSLKAMKVDSDEDLQALRHMAHYGINDILSAKAYMNGKKQSARLKANKQMAQRAAKYILDHC